MKNSQSGDWFSIHPDFSDEHRVVIRQAMLDWHEKYHCDRHITVAQFNGRLIVLPNGDRPVEKATPGEILIDPSENMHCIRNSMLHAMTHACTADHPIILKDPLKIQIGDSIVDAYGYHGASILVAFEDGYKAFFTKLEEAICERNASKFREYATRNVRYFRVGELAIKHFPSDIVEQLVKENDVPGIVGIILGKPGHDVTIDDIQEVIDLYSDTWFSAKD